jgi:hypothetical protein
MRIAAAALASMCMLAPLASAQDTRAIDLDGDQARLVSCVEDFARTHATEEVGKSGGGTALMIGALIVCSSYLDHYEASVALMLQDMNIGKAQSHALVVVGLAGIIKQAAESADRIVRAARARKGLPTGPVDP